MRRVKFFIYILLVGANCIGFAPMYASADAAPELYPLGGTIGVPNEERDIAMIRETVEFTVDDTAKVETDSGDNGVPAKVTFRLHNLKSSAKKIEVFFPTEIPPYYNESFTPAIDKRVYAAHVQASLDGTVLSGKEGQGTYLIIDRKTKKRYKTSGDGIHFPIAVPAKKDVALTLKFDAPKGDYDLGSGSLGYSLYYLLASGAGWHGSIGTADVIFHFFKKPKKDWVKFYYSGGDHPNVMFTGGRTMPLFTKKMKEIVRGNDLVWTLKNFKPDDSYVLIYAVASSH